MYIVNTLLTKVNILLTGFMRKLSPKKVVEEIKLILNIHTDIELAERLQVHRQSLSRYQKRTEGDIQTNMISLLLDEINKSKE